MEVGSEEEDDEDGEGGDYGDEEDDEGKGSGGKKKSGTVCSINPLVCIRSVAS